MSDTVKKAALYKDGCPFYYAASGENAEAVEKADCARRFSPLMLTGPSACGKTHLLTGFYERFRAACPQKEAYLLSAFSLWRYLTDCIIGQDAPGRYDNAGFLGIDNTFVLQGCLGAQSSFCDLIHTVTDRGGCVMLAVDDAGTVEVLRGGCGWTVAALTFPDRETLRAYAQDYIRRESFAVPEDVLTPLLSSCRTVAALRSAILNYAFRTEQSAVCDIFDPKTQNRVSLANAFTRLGLSTGETAALTARMRGKSDEQKEELAAQLLRELLASLPHNGGES